MFNEFKESFFLYLANNLPRLNRFNRFRTKFLRKAGLEIGKNTIFWTGIDIRPIGAGSKVIVGQSCFCNTNIKFAGLNGNAFIRIGDNVAIGPDVQFHCMNHNLKWDTEKKWGGGGRSIIVEDRVWIGARTIILPGVTIKSDTVIGAGSVVTKDLEGHVLAVGNPARIIKQL